MSEKKIKVIGAGEIRISGAPTSELAEEKGFELNFQLGPQGFLAGGLLPLSQAVELAHFILASANQVQL